MFNKILVATDSPSDVDGATFTAAELAALNGSELCVLHVLESSYSGKYRQYVRHYKTGKEIVADMGYETAVKKDLENTISDLVKPLESYTVKIRLGIPWEQILRQARDKVDLIVLGAHTRKAEIEGIARGTKSIGSTVEEVILRERCPVMIVNEPARQEQLRFERILVPVDFSDSCAYALKFASRLTENHGGHLMLLHVAQENAAAEKNPLLITKMESLARKFSLQTPRDYVLRHGSLPYLEILKYAAEQGVDLIVMGSHTRKDEERPYVGSAVVQVSCRSLRPVVVVNAAKALWKDKTSSHETASTSQDESLAQQIQTGLP